MDFVIRDIDEKDFLKIARLFKKLRRVSEKYMFEFYSEYRKWTKMKSDEDVVNDVIKPKVFAKNSKFLVLEIDWFIAGFAYWSLFVPNSEVYVENDYVWWDFKHMFIDEEYRWNWFASKLRDALFSWFESKEVKVVEIGMNPDNPVWDIYKKWWFESKFCSMSRKL